MNQIALGDPASGWLILLGDSVSPPFIRASYQSVFSPGAQATESLEIHLEGAPAVITAALESLEKVIQRARLNERSGSPGPQFLRFQPAAGGEYFYAALSDLHLETPPNAWATHQIGSLPVTLHFTRPNHFDSDEIELPLTTRSVSDQLGGVSLINHFDAHPGHSNSVLIKPADVAGALPAPLRIELTNTHPAGYLHDLLIGIFHHPNLIAEQVFTCHASEIAGGESFSNPNAINETYVRFQWSSTSLTALGTWLFSNEDVRDLSGRFFRPLLHFYNSHAWPDLLLKLKLQAGSYILAEYEAIWSDPEFKYAVFPPLKIPPNPLLLEGLPHHIDLVLYGQHNAAGTYQIEIDALTLLPLDYAAFFLAFYDVPENAIFIEDNFRRLHNVRFSAIGSETVAHVRQGGDLLIHPDEYNRVIFTLTDQDDEIDIFRTGSVRLFYRKRVRIL